MSRGDQQRVADILAAADGLAARLTMSFEEWRADEDRRLVTERLLVNAYHRVQPDLLWTAATVDVPALAAAIRAAAQP